MAEDHKKTLESRLWDIANTLRGKMGADEFRDYILGFIFYKYLSERMHLFVLDRRERFQQISTDREEASVKS